MGKESDREVIFGTGKENGSVCPAFKGKGVNINPVYLTSEGNLWFQFGSLEGKPIFGSVEDRRELMIERSRYRGGSGSGFVSGGME